MLTKITARNNITLVLVSSYLLELPVTLTVCFYWCSGNKLIKWLHTEWSDMNLQNAKTFEYGGDAFKKQVKIQVFTGDTIFNGYICCHGSMRLLDVLNGGVGSLCSDSKFVCISRCEKDTQDINELRKNAAYINKSKILFLKEDESLNDTETNKTKKQTAYPYVEKISSLYRVKSMAYNLEGYVHHLKGQNINDILNNGSRFLPMTDVKINTGYEGIASSADFIAVNKDQISFLENILAD